MLVRGIEVLMVRGVDIYGVMVRGVDIDGVMVRGDGTGCWLHTGRDGGRLEYRIILHL